MALPLLGAKAAQLANTSLDVKEAQNKTKQKTEAMSCL